MTGDDFSRGVRRSFVRMLMLISILVSASACSQQERDTIEQPDTRVHLLTQAEDAFECDDFEHAIALYTRLLSGDTDQALVYTRRAAAYIKLQQYNAALQDIKNALILNPKNLEAYYLRGVAYELDPRQTQSGQRYFTRAAKGQATTAADYFVRGKAYLFLRQPEQAIAALDQAIEQDPDDAYLYYWRARAWQASNQAEQALADFTEALAHNPEKTAFYADRGQLYHAAGCDQEAIQDFSSAIAFAPQNAEYYFYRGQAYAALLTPEKALRDFTQAMQLAPKRARYACWRGQMYESLFRYQDALNDYTHATTLNPDEECGYSGRGSVYATLGDYQQALIEYNEFQKRSPQLNESFYSNRAAIYENLGHYDQALADYTEAIQLAPYKAFLFYSRGMLYAMLDDFTQAAEDCENALLLDDGQGNCLANFCLGVVHSAQQGEENYRKALEHYTQALNPDCYVHTYQFIASTYVRIGMIETELGTISRDIINAYQTALVNHPDHVYANVLLGDQLQDENAITHYSKAIAIEPEYAVPYLKRGLAYKRTGKLEQAKTDFQQAKRLAIRSHWRQIAEEQLLLLELSAPLPSPTPFPPAVVPESVEALTPPEENISP